MTREQLNEKDEYILIGGLTYFNVGDIVTLIYDDGTNAPRFRKVGTDRIGFISLYKLSPKNSISKDDYCLTF